MVLGIRSALADAGRIRVRRIATAVEAGERASRRADGVGVKPGVKRPTPVRVEAQAAAAADFAGVLLRRRQFLASRAYERVAIELVADLPADRAGEIRELALEGRR